MPGFSIQCLRIIFKYLDYIYIYPSRWSSTLTWWGGSCALRNSDAMLDRYNQTRQGWSAKPNSQEAGQVPVPPYQNMEMNNLQTHASWDVTWINKVPALWRVTRLRVISRLPEKRNVGKDSVGNLDHIVCRCER